MRVLLILLAVPTSVLILLAVPTSVALWAVWVGRRRTRHLDDPRVAVLAEARADRTREGFSCAQLPTERPGMPRVRGRS